ncbi:hypothetical protein HDU98_010169, partial [Podochytrium sp. JEL0797]
MSSLSLPRPRNLSVPGGPVGYYPQTQFSSSSVAVLFTAELAIDRIAWQLWLAGDCELIVSLYPCAARPLPPVDHAYAKVIQRNKQTQPNYDSVVHPSPAVVKNYLLSQYRSFELLEKYLHRPKLLSSQLIFPLSPETRKFLIDTYYSFDPKVIRELLGKKLSSRATRKELEDAQVRAGVPLAGCRRMFDNLKRIMKRIEDQNGNIFKLVQDDFLLEDDLAG